MKPNWSAIVLGVASLSVMAVVAIFKGPMFGAVLGGVGLVLQAFAPKILEKGGTE